MRGEVASPSDSQKDGDSTFSGPEQRISCARRRRYIAKGFYARLASDDSRGKTKKNLLTIPHFCNLVAAKKYHNAALRLICLRTLRSAACAKSNADGASSAFTLQARLVPSLGEHGHQKLTLAAADTSHRSPSNMSLRKSLGAMLVSQRTESFNA